MVAYHLAKQFLYNLNISKYFECVRRHSVKVDPEKKLPSFWQVLGIELVTLVIDVLAMIITIFFVIGGLVRLLTFFIDMKSVLKPWLMIGELWQPIKWHYLFLGWIISSAIKKRRDKQPVYRGRSQTLESRCYSPDEVFEAIFVGVQLAYLGVLLVCIVGAFLIPGAAIVAIKYNREAQLVVPKIAEKPKYRPSEIQVQEMDFEPFIAQSEVESLRSKPGVNNFCLVEDTGEVRYSRKWTIDPNLSKWKMIPSNFKITAYEIRGSAVIFTDDRSNKLCLNIEQPFAFENNATLVFVFKTDGLYVAKRDDLEKVSISMVKSNARPNLGLSIL